MRPWKTLDRVETADGLLELRQRGDAEFLVCIDGRVLMSSFASRSEAFLARVPCQLVAGHGDASRGPRVLLAGLGVGITLRVALDHLPPRAQVQVVELNADVVRWCQGPLAPAHGDALADPRVRVWRGDVADAIAEASPGHYDAVILDLYEGPHEATQGANDPCFGRAALQRAKRALHREGVLAVWGEAVDVPFERRLRRAGFRFERRQPGKGGSPHCVWICRPA